MSEVSISNKALGWLGADRITNLDDPQTEAVIAKENYAEARDFVLADHDWPFAIKRFNLALSTEKPAFGYANKFLIPDEILRVISLNEHDPAYSSGQTINTSRWDVENGFIVSDDLTANVRAVARITETRLFSPGFVNCVAARMAADMALAVTSSSNREKSMEGKYQLFLRQAKRQDGRQGKSKRLVSTYLKQARWSGSSGFFGPTV